MGKCGHCGGISRTDLEMEKGKYRSRRGYCSCLTREPITKITGIAPQPDRSTGASPKSETYHHTENKHTQARKLAELERTEAFLKDKKDHQELPTIKCVDTRIIGGTSGTSDTSSSTSSDTSSNAPRITGNAITLAAAFTQGCTSAAEVQPNNMAILGAARPSVDKSVTKSVDKSFTKSLAKSAVLSKENDAGIANKLQNVNLFAKESLFAKEHPLVKDYVAHLDELHQNMKKCIAKDQMQAALKARAERHEFFKSTINWSVDADSQALGDLFENDYVEALQNNQYNIRALMHQNSSLMQELRELCRKEDESMAVLVKQFRDEGNPHTLNHVNCIDIFQTNAIIKEIRFSMSYNVEDKELALGLLNLLVIPKCMKNIVETLEHKGKVPISIVTWYLKNVQTFLNAHNIISTFRSEAKKIREKRRSLRKWPNSK